MMNRVGLGLAVGAGYVLGRTKKLKLAFAIGTMVAGKRMNLGPRAIADLVSQQLKENPQFKELGDQLRGDLRGAGKAATGALVERQIEGLADRLHGRTAQVRDQLSGTAPDRSGRDEDDGVHEDEDERAEASDEYDEEDTGAPSGADDSGDSEDTDADSGPERGKPARKTAARAAKKAPAKKTAAARKGTAKKAAAKKTAARKTTPAKKTARKTTRSRATRGGGGDD